MRKLDEWLKDYPIRLQKSPLLKFEKPKSFVKLAVPFLLSFQVFGSTYFGTRDFSDSCHLALKTLTSCLNDPQHLHKICKKEILGFFSDSFDAFEEADMRLLHSVDITGPCVIKNYSVVTSDASSPFSTFMPMELVGTNGSTLIKTSQDGRTFIKSGMMTYQSVPRPQSTSLIIAADIETQVNQNIQIQQRSTSKILDQLDVTGKSFSFRLESEPFQGEFSSWKISDVDHFLLAQQKREEEAFLQSQNEE